MPGFYEGRKWRQPCGWNWCTFLDDGLRWPWQRASCCCCCCEFPPSAQDRHLGLRTGARAPPAICLLGAGCSKGSRLPVRAGAAQEAWRWFLGTPGCSGESWFSLLLPYLSHAHQQGPGPEIPTRHTSHCKDWPVALWDPRSLAPSLPSQRGGWFQCPVTSVQLELTLGSGLIKRCSGEGL